MKTFLASKVFSVTLQSIMALRALVYLMYTEEKYKTK